MQNIKCAKLTVDSITMQCLAVVLASVMTLASGAAVNYCGSRMCANTNAHTFCQFPEGPSHHCVGYISAPLTLEEKSRVLARLNRRRNEAASGRVRGFPSAGDMLKLRWVEELAREAQRWADQCRLPRTVEEHDACRNLYSLSVGQCVASVVGEAPGLRVESMVDIWYMQSMLYKGNITFYVPTSRNGSAFYGDFAQIMWAQSYMVGCGRSRFMIPWQDRLRSVERLVCNIAPLGPPPTRPLWTPAAPAASCPPRSQRDSVMPALCDYQRYPKEIKAVNSSTLHDVLLLDTVLEIENNETLNYLGSLDEIYLTKMAIATMENTITTRAYYNSIQRRDVVEVLDLVDNKLLPEEVTPQITTTLPPPVEETTVIKVTKTPRKLRLIGRPKSYNMEDLTIPGEETEHKTPNEELQKRRKEFYPEYDFVETVDDNNTTLTSTDVTNTTELPGIVNILINQDVLRDVVTRLYQNSSMLDAEPLNTFIGNAILQSGVISPNESTVVSTSTAQSGNASTNDNVDDYNLSDPETVRELQEALDRIEQDMATKSGKVRRELGDIIETAESSTSNDQKLYEALRNVEIERNKSIERGPMYNMVLKYMPYLKQYEGGLLTNSDGVSSSSISSRMSPLIVLVVTLCL